MIDANELAIASGAATYVVGLGADYLATKRAASETEAPVGLYDELFLDETVSQQTAGHASLAQNVGKYAARHLLPLSLGLAAGLNVYAWTPDTQPVKEIQPTVELVVDHSGATAFEASDKKTLVSKVDAVVGQFVDNKSFKTQAIVASSGNEVLMNTTNVASSEPFGPADLGAATGLALNTAGEVQSKHIDRSGKPSAAVLVVTNGNDIGTPKGVLGESTQKIGATRVNTPVFVFNVAEKTNPVTEKNLRAIAKNTNATYWNGASKDLKEIPTVVEKKLANSKATEQQANQQSKLAPKILGGVALLGVGAAYLSRRQRLFGRGLDGLKTKKEK